MNKISFALFTLSFFLFQQFITAQEALFVPNEIQRAVKNGTRTNIGEPGKYYWQNKIKYNIKAHFDPGTGLLKGKENIIYTNKSPYFLSSLVINLYPNLYKKGSKRDKPVHLGDLHDGLIISKIFIDDEEIDPHGEDCYYEGTLLYLSLPTSLQQNKQIKLSIAWEFNMQKTTQLRTGKYGKNTWFIGYWYPQIAVFDDIFGWDEVPYDGLHEFYSPFADYNVTITVPENQLIWATGIWQNPEAILLKKYLKRYNKSLTSDDIVQIIKPEDLNKNTLQTLKTNLHTWHFKANNVIDFAFAISDHYLWDATSLIVDKNTKRRTVINVAYDKNSLDFYDVAKISKKTIQYLSDSMPGIPFPYPRMSVFNGGGGMEYPMMVNDRSESNYKEMIDLTSHEISHTYFPFYMGINQERYAWMDEGWAMFLPSELQDRLAKSKNNAKAAYSTFVYNLYAGNSSEATLMTPSYHIKNYEYYVASYYKPEIAYRILQDLLGKEVFLKAIQSYIHRWNGKYPNPYDFFNTINHVANKDLTWFRKPWFFEFGYPDLGIEKVSQEKTSFNITIEKIGSLPEPIYIKIFYEDDSIAIIKESAEVWKNGNTRYKITHTAKKKIKKLILGNETIPDINKKNNLYTN
ncbi:MAG: peptidase [Bacteroidetes bacterium]|nr:MAG: peptidase [Bacteroidota bacterium]